MKFEGTSRYRRLSARSLLLYEMAKRRAERNQRIFGRDFTLPSPGNPRSDRSFPSDQARGVGVEKEVSKDDA